MLSIRSLLLTFLGSCFLILVSAGAEQPYDFKLEIPPRKQWNANDGYCGETSFISAGLYYGQYCSQFEARRIASPGIHQSKRKSQLLLGVNDYATAEAMRLTAVQWDTHQQNNTEEFLTWTKSHLLQGYPVIIGVFTNEYKFYNNLNPNAGDPAYDHIVPVIGIFSDRPLDLNSNRYFRTDSLMFYDNGLWSPNRTPRNRFRYRFSRFPLSRTEANQPTAPVYSLNSNRRNYGIAITGVADLNSDTVPVRLTTSVNGERPAMRNGSNTPPEPRPLEITATVTLPDPSVAYVLYRYDSFDAVPVSDFNANAAHAVETWQIPANSGAEFVVTQTFLSNDVVVFRAVRATAG